MGRVCSWCGAVLRATAGTSSPVTHVLCGGCLEEMRAVLASQELRSEVPATRR